ncbi:Uncharacterized protein DBV15_10022 [Temnothorax longispinosus]|uniref:Uncharacterized protein n=1 Tax=Temnothorax longispinosus TaxID=300112 RepID=A0A4S2KYG0_9HYME|nr:Uncharacterized protein DBV15_10022 [Temnothorax longispinosus]
MGNKDVGDLVKLELKIKFGDETDKFCEHDTYPAHEAVRMPLTVESRYIILHDSTVAAAALGREHVEIVLAAVGLAVPFMEALLAELLTALGTEEVFGVPSLLQGGHAFLEEKHFSRIPIIEGYLAHDGLLTSVAASLLGCVDSLAAHVGLEITKHRIQLVLLERLALSRMVEMGRVGLGDVDASLRALGGFSDIPSFAILKCEKDFLNLEIDNLNFSKS